MKTRICILAIGLMLSACHSEKKMLERRAAFVSAEPVDLTVHGTVQDTLVLEEKPEPARPETVVHTQGAELMH